MILSRIEMNRSYPAIRKALADRQQLHRLVMGLFDASRQEAQVLFRCREQGMSISLYIYSSVNVDKSRLLPGMKLTGNRDLSAWLDGLSLGLVLGFDLLTFPFKKEPVEGKNSRRRVLRSYEERYEWMERKAEQNGFRIISLQEIPGSQVSAVHNEGEGGALYFNCYEYQGVLEITDEAAFRKSVEQGIGPEKAYGLGMLLLK